MVTEFPFLGGRDRKADTISAEAASSGADLSFSTSAEQVARATMSAAMDGGSKLVVGANIKLKGDEITDCNILVVEGVVEARMKARVMQIAEQGVFKGSVEIDLAEIRGRFDGNLTVRQILVINSTGKVRGKVRYSRIAIEEGGQLSGEISFGAAQANP
jgi:cytoskeletal protein CcmA (bactofilin family)